MMPNTIPTDRLALVRWTIGDETALREALDASDAHLRPWIPFMAREPCSLAQTRSNVAEFIEQFSRGQHFRYAVWTASSALVGEVMLLHADTNPEALELGYWIAAGQTRNGFGREAVTAIVEAAFTHTSTKTLVCRCDAHNAASIALAQSIGAVETRSEISGPNRLIHLVTQRP